MSSDHLHADPFRSLHRQPCALVRPDAPAGGPPPMSSRPQARGSLYPEPGPWDSGRQAPGARPSSSRTLELPQRADPPPAASRGDPSGPSPPRVSGEGRGSRQAPEADPLPLGLPRAAWWTERAGRPWRLAGSAPVRVTAAAPTALTPVKWAPLHLWDHPPPGRLRRPAPLSPHP